MMDKDQARHVLRSEGAVMIPKLLGEELVFPARSAITLAANLNYADPSTWSTESLDPHGSVPIYQDQSIWNIRQSQEIYEYYSYFYGTNKLRMNVSRASVKVPDPDLPSSRLPSWPMHLDCNPYKFSGRNRSYQAVVYLTDVAEDEGPFAFCPGLDVLEFANNNPDAVKIGGAEGLMVHNEHAPFEMLKPMPGPAGSVIFFDRMMLHCGLSNVGARPRVAMFMTMDVAESGFDYSDLQRCWRERSVPEWAENRWGQLSSDRQGDPAVLSELGRKLIGLEGWEE